MPPAVKRRREEDSSCTNTSLEAHFPIKGPSSRCSYCWNYKKHCRHETTIHCRRCGKALCVTSRDPPESGPSCFERYHTECMWAWQPMAILCVVALARFRTYLRSLYTCFTCNYLQDYSHTTTQVPCRVTACLLPIVNPFTYFVLHMPVL